MGTKHLLCILKIHLLIYFTVNGMKFFVAGRFGIIIVEFFKKSKICKSVLILKHEDLNHFFFLFFLSFFSIKNRLWETLKYNPHSCT